MENYKTDIQEYLELKEFKKNIESGMIGHKVEYPSLNKSVMYYYTESEMITALINEIKELKQQI